ncbi:DUF99 family protein [Methylocaldum sp.]|uniref:endonuclease dU n=1 Tax=Methylocaldum sp. TaxID=1969727 RepID=UPI002D54A3A9|nr:DUF99 family protein [Methylocaldum sp.]HYE33953.1 DUF99 family protein [Methylocaldum sp.]
MAYPHLSHVIGFDDAPFERSHRGDVIIVGAFYAGHRLDGVLSGQVRRDGINSTRVLIDLVSSSRFYPHLQAILLQGIAFGGFNVVDIHRLHEALDRPVVVVARHLPNLGKIRDALLNHVPGGQRKWRLIEQAGPMEPMADVYVQRAGLSAKETAIFIRALAVHGRLPEPLRTAHIIAGGISRGESIHRP